MNKVILLIIAMILASISAIRVNTDTDTSLETEGWPPGFRWLDFAHIWVPKYLQIDAESE